MSEFIPPRPPVGQRPPKRESTFGQQRKPLQRKSPLKVTFRHKPRMSAEARVQEAMLGKGRCWLVDAPGHRCTDGHTQRAHIVPQQTLRNVFPLGAYRSGGMAPEWRPICEWMDKRTMRDEIRTLQEILDDARNIVPVCPNGNIDGPGLVAALDEVGSPEGAGTFQAEYGFEFNGNYWYRAVKPVVLNTRGAS